MQHQSEVELVHGREPNERLSCCVWYRFFLPYWVFVGFFSPCGLFFPGGRGDGVVDTLLKIMLSVLYVFSILSLF